MFRKKTSVYIIYCYDYGYLASFKMEDEQIKRLAFTSLREATVYTESKEKAELTSKILRRFGYYNRVQKVRLKLNGVL